jgi:hypothetical protein
MRLVRKELQGLKTAVKIKEATGQTLSRIVITRNKVINIYG